MIMAILLLNRLSVTSKLAVSVANQEGKAMNIIKSLAGIEYRRQEFTDAWGRKRVCDKRLSDMPKPHNTACACCGKQMDSARSTKRFCSAGCRVKASRARPA